MPPTSHNIEAFGKTITTGDYQAFKQMLAQEPALASQSNLYNELNTPLHVATFRNQKKMVADLLAAGAETEPFNLKHQTPTSIAVEHSHYDLVDQFIAHGAKVRDVEGITLVCIAAQKGDEKMVNKLLAAGADPNETTKDGKTPLHYIAMSARPDDRTAARMVQALYQAGADPTITDQDGAKPEDIARSPHRKKVLEHLAYGIDTETWRERRLSGFHRQIYRPGL